MTETSFAQFNGKIGPSNLLSLVRNTAPFLFDSLDKPGNLSGKRLIEMGGHSFGWLDILIHAEQLEAANDPTTQQREDYFALCLACHHATVATYIPTDVDSKIRGHLWQQREDPQALRRMFDFAVGAMQWDISRISARATELSGVGPVSGHNGEMLGVLAGALGGFIKNGDPDYAERAAEAIDKELERECAEYRFALSCVRQTQGLRLETWGLRHRPAVQASSLKPQASTKSWNLTRAEHTNVELDLLRLSSSLTHNVGDLDQGISFWSQREAYQPYRQKFHRLAHENKEPYGGIFQIAAGLYKQLLAAEGHRHYPLRDVRALRTSPDFLLPLGPFFDAWGERVGSHPGLDIESRAETLAALLQGCRKIPNQMGYYRAIAGMARVLNGKLDAVARRMPASLRQELKDSKIRQHIALKQISFESQMRKRAVAILEIQM